MARAILLFCLFLAACLFLWHAARLGLFSADAERGLPSTSAAPLTPQQEARPVLSDAERALAYAVADARIDADVTVLGDVRVNTLDPHDVVGTIAVSCFLKGSLVFSQSAEVLAGRWSMRVPTQSILVVERLVLRGTPAWPEFADYAVPDTGNVTINATLTLDYKIRVVDAESAASVMDLRALPLPAISDSALSLDALRLHPGFCVLDAAMPVESPVPYRALGAGDYLITSIGYEWATLTLGSTRASLTFPRKSGHPRWRDVRQDVSHAETEPPLLHARAEGRRRAPGAQGRQRVSRSQGPGSD